MRKLILLIGLLSTCFLFSCRRTGLKKYYTKISPEEFASFDSTVVVARSKFGIIYRAYTFVSAKLGTVKLDFLVFKKNIHGSVPHLFKLDVEAEIKNDSTFIFYGNPLKVAGDTSNFVEGVWFYENHQGTKSIFCVDSVPKNLPPINLQQLTMGIYLYKGKKLVKISTSQSEESFSNLSISGFFYLPNPGRFYTLANFNEIQ